MKHTRTTADFQRLEGLAGGIADREFRASYMAHSLRSFLADQIRALRDERSQRVFGEIIGKPQSVVSRLENEDYGKVTLQTLIDIAEKLDIALVVRFTDFPTFLRSTGDFSEKAVAPDPFTQAALNAMLREESETNEPSVALRAVLAASYEQNFMSAAQLAANAPNSLANNPLLSNLQSLHDTTPNWIAAANSERTVQTRRGAASPNKAGALEDVA